jgi:hypothetical protein
VDANYRRDLAIKIADYVWYDYLGLKDQFQEFDYPFLDTIEEIIKEHLEQLEPMKLMYPHKEN